MRDGAGAGFLSSPGPATFTNMPSICLSRLALLLLLPLAGCRSAGRFLEEAFRERPPAPLEVMTLASDARMDSIGRLAGSFVGEGTSRAVHLVSSDTSLIAALARRYQGAAIRNGDVWGALSRAGVIRLNPREPAEEPQAGPMVSEALVGSPEGFTDVVVTAITLRGGRCGWRGAQAEIVVEPRGGLDEPGLRGPVLGSLRRMRGSADDAGPVRREPLPEPDRLVVSALLERTRAARDSILAGVAPGLDLRAPDPARRVEINTLADVDAADVIPFRAGNGTVRYAVSLRERRITARGDTLVASAVMAWDESGAWQQTIFRPTLVQLSRGGLAPYGALRRTYFWRRLQPVAVFGTERDNLWMEQVDVRDGSVMWGVVEPRGNVLVAAAEMEGPCR
jgi:hypothetical protein